MASFKDLSDKIPKPLKEIFPSVVDFRLVEQRYGGSVIVGFVLSQSINDLTPIWRNINSYLTVNYVATLEDEFSKWNYYLFYLTKDDVPRSIKYEIENNKFSSRKIVLPNFNEELTDERINSLIAENVTNADIRPDGELAVSKEFEKSVTLSKLIEKIPLSKKGEWETEYKNVLSKIEKSFDNEIQEN